MLPYNWCLRRENKLNHIQKNTILVPLRGSFFKISDEYPRPFDIVSPGLFFPFFRFSLFLFVELCGSYHSVSLDQSKSFLTRWRADLTLLGKFLKLCGIQIILISPPS